MRWRCEGAGGVKALGAVLLAVAVSGCGPGGAGRASEQRIETVTREVDAGPPAIVDDLGRDRAGRDEPTLDPELDVASLSACEAVGVASLFVIHHEDRRPFLEGRPVWAEWEATMAALLAKVPEQLLDEIDVIRRTAAEGARALAATSLDVSDPAVQRQIDANRAVAESPEVREAAEVIERHLLSCPDL
jgi:hypothetical protein